MAVYTGSLPLSSIPAAKPGIHTIPSERNYQHEIARRHMTARKNLTDDVSSTRYVPFRDCLAFVAVMNEMIKPYPAMKGHPVEQVERMHRAWCKSIQLQMALWAKAYSDAACFEDQW
jgi:Protoglobin